MLKHKTHAFLLNQNQVIIKFSPWRILRPCSARRLHSSRVQRDWVRWYKDRLSPTVDSTRLGSARLGSRSVTEVRRNFRRNKFLCLCSALMNQLI